MRIVSHLDSLGEDNTFDIIEFQVLMTQAKRNENTQSENGNDDELF